MMDLLVASAGKRAELVAEGSVSRLPKVMIEVVAGAMKRSLAAAVASDLVRGGGEPGASLLLGIFQDRLYFEEERTRYAAFAASHTTVVAGFPGAPAEPAPGVIGLDTSGRPELESAWILLVAGASLGAVLAAIDEHRADPDRPLEGGRIFSTSWTFRRQDAVDAARGLLAPLRGRLPARQLAEIEAALGAAEAPHETPAEELLGTAIAAIVSGLGERAAEDTSPRFGERDLLTGLPNHRYLKRFLGSRDSAVPLGVLFVDLDDLAGLNERRGREAGDAALVAVANALRDESGRASLVARYDDDFALVIPGSTREGVLELAERLLVSVRALRLPFPFGEESIQTSIGVELATAPTASIPRLRAAVRQAKRLGQRGVIVLEAPGRLEADGS